VSGTSPLPGVARDMSAVCGANLREEDYSKIEADEVEDFLVPSGYSGDCGDGVHEALVVSTGRRRQVGQDIVYVQGARDEK
jgi:hypothetical protein